MICSVPSFHLFVLENKRDSLVLFLVSVDGKAVQKTSRAQSAGGFFWEIQSLHKVFGWISP